MIPLNFLPPSSPSLLFPSPPKGANLLTLCPPPPPPPTTSETRVVIPKDLLVSSLAPMLKKLPPRVSVPRFLTEQTLLATTNLGAILTNDERCLDPYTENA
ncbi:hypothetical protein BOTNAR_0014g00160 [Botryotinia narcissicola]|uniref:Uncharacterized protein n=1 Tax=Botryotinia narcissicola TaxID=278944 RepID=A0A4Z1J7M0_9HELO|nr:hypothetical protein BOTNAR_0014g00160 [Botryotinia narcissicola]